MLALAMMLSLAPQGVLAGDLTDSAAEVQEAYGDGSAADGGSPENGTESGTTLAQGNSGEDNAQSGTAVSGDSGTDSSLFDTASGGEKAVSSSGSGEEESSSGTADRLVQEEGARPAVLLETEADDGTSIRIDAPEGAFPEGIRVTVRAVAADSILDALRTAADDPELAAEDVAAYDFDFWLDDGTHQIEPEKEITVQIGLPELKAGETVSAYHMDSESDETAEAETVTAEQDTGTATLTSDAFSIHAIVRRAQAAGGVKIDYDAESTIHSVTASDGSKIILFCMNDGLHWPHSTPTTPNVPDYSETSIEAFCAANHVSDSSTLARKVKNVLYAGYPYNGYGLYQVVDQAASLTEDEYNQFLDPPAYLRTDFPDSVGSNTFAYSDRSDKSKMALLAKFVQESMTLYPNGSTSSGLTYSQLTALPFWRAAYCMVTYTDSPIDAYSTLYISGSYVTEPQAYTSTSNAVWTLMYNSGVPNNTAVAQDTLTTKLLDAAENDTILEQVPSSGSLSVTGDTTFRYSSEDGKWHTGRLTLSAPSGYLTPFALTLPDGVSEESGKTQVRAGTGFSLVSSSPTPATAIALSATVPWMDGDLRVYEPMGNVTASDGKAYQNMVGAVIRTADVSVSASLARADENTELTFTKKWDDSDNQDGVRPTAEAYASKLHLMNGDTEVENVTPTVTDNGDNTYTVTYSGLPKYVNGAEAAYSVKEDGIDGYTADAETVKNGATLMNTHTPEVTTVTVTKKWEDANNQDGMRVSAADYASKLHLMNGDTEVENVTPTVTDNGDNTYTVTYSSLPKYVNGAEAAYSVKEDGIDGYTADAETVKNGATLMNTHTPEVTTVTVTKKWEDANNQDGMRVSAADYASKLHLMNGDTEVGECHADSDGQRGQYVHGDVQQPSEVREWGGGRLQREGGRHRRVHGGRGDGQERRDADEHPYAGSHHGDGHEEVGGREQSGRYARERGGLCVEAPPDER